MLIFYFFAAFQVFFGYKSLRGGVDYLYYFKQELQDKKTFYEPFVTIMIPCRGIDDDLETNLLSILDQEYADHEIIFVVDDEADESLSIINKLISTKTNARSVIAGMATDCGQKVHNLRSAVLEVSEKSQVLAFVDSDARPDREWLRNLVAPLIDPEIGCSTGYRWFIQKKGGFATQLRSVWNASIASALGRDQENNFCWGGSMAIRRDVFEKLDIRSVWKRTLSDDFALANALSDAKMPIVFVPQCLTASVGDCDLGELLEFSTRQMKITRVYSTRYWIISFISALLFTVVFWGGIGLLFVVSGINFWMTLFLIGLIFLLGAAKAWIRLTAVKMVFTDHEDKLDRQKTSQLLFWVITPLVFLYNDIQALISRKIVWRGIKYELRSAKETVIISRTEKS